MGSEFQQVKDFMDFTGIDYCHMNDFIMYLDSEMADSDFTLELITSLLFSLKKEYEGCPEDMEYFKIELEGVLRDVVGQE